MFSLGDESDDSQPLHITGGRGGPRGQAHHAGGSGGAGEGPIVHITTHQLIAHNLQATLAPEQALQLRNIQASQIANHCPPPSRIFQSRQDILNKMHQFFSDTGVQHIYVLHGLGGAGKTQIALKFIKESSSRFSDIFFIDTSTITTIDTGLKNIAVLKNFGDSPQDGLLWLTSKVEQWLLFFDNADDPSISLNDFIPQCNHGNVIITSRNPGLRVYAGSHSLVSDMKEEDAVALLLKSGSQKATIHTEQIATEIVKSLHYLPLAIVQAGAFISKSQDLDGYLALYTKNQAQLLSEKSAQPHDGYAWTVYTTWQMSFDRLTPPAAMFLQHCSFLHYNGISEEIFSYASKYTFPSGSLSEELQEPLEFLSHFLGPTGEWDSLQFLNTTNEVQAYSLISFDAEKKLFSIHPLVHSWIRGTVQNPRRYMSTMGSILGMAISEHPQWDMQLASLLLCPHIELAVQMDAEVALGFRHQYVMTLWEGGRYKQAVKLQEEVLEEEKQVLGDNHPDTLHTMGKLAKSYSNLGEHQKAKELQVIVLEKQKQVLGDNHPDTLRTMAIVQLLIEHNTSVNLPNKSGRTALQLAVENGHLDITQLLMEHDTFVNHANELNARHHALLNEIGSLLSHRPLNDIADINPVPALTWICKKYDSASLELPLRVAIYMRGLLQDLSPQARQLRTENPDFRTNGEMQTLVSMPIASAFLITNTDDTQFEAHSILTALRLNDFNGHQTYVPLVLCRSWKDLCVFLGIILKGHKGSNFITSGNFSIRVPNEENLLLSWNTWNSWISHFDEDMKEHPVTLDLYAVLRDDTNSCPNCNRQNPVTHPLPPNSQECSHCHFTFLVIYEDEPEEVTMTNLELPQVETIDEVPLDTPLSSPPHNSNTSDGNSPVPSTPTLPVVAEGVTQSMNSAPPEPEQPGELPSSPVIQASGVSVLPKNVQLTRRRKRQTRQTSLIDQSDNSINTVSPIHLDFLLNLYMLVLFKLPDHYSRGAQHQPLMPGASSNNGWEKALYKKWKKEWAYMGRGAVVMYCLLLLRKEASDLTIWTLVWLSTICLLFGFAYAFILLWKFGQFETNAAEGLPWIHHIAHLSKNSLWNSKVMLSMPGAWIFWGAFWFAISLLASFLLSGPAEQYENSKPSLKRENGLRGIIGFVVVLGLIYGGLMIHDMRSLRTRRMGPGLEAPTNVTGTLLREGLNIALHDLLGGGQISIAHLINITGGNILHDCLCIPVLTPHRRVGGHRG
ncbi:hypothetical protein C8F04DRAFT_521579 [Mycena alexandri]|uniref:NB-ARC domain-containing protein n=1 Tax=Mycena alexandri TaxID=1745969 RepID=A0AAD6TJI5_9AGAR|nr:hypothetical protein C8F04DRAFT_521579 [Mycena alexandri]